MAETINIRQFEDTDLGSVLDVLRASLGDTPPQTPELFSWKHFRNPFGRSIVLVATAGSRIAGVRAFMRWEMITADGEILRCVRAVDTATHPDFARQGIFSRLTTEAVDRASEDGVDLIFNTPNPKSGAGYLKLGWTEVGPIGIMGRPTLRMLRRRQQEADPDPRSFLTAPEPVTQVSRSDRPARGLRTPRSEAYRLWRFQQHPTARYFQVPAEAGMAIVRPNVRGIRRELVVSEVHGEQPRQALNAVVGSSRADYLAAWWSKGSPERSAAIRAGILPVPGRTALTLMCRPLRSLLPPVENLAAWDLGLSDLELL